VIFGSSIRRSRRHMISNRALAALAFVVACGVPAGSAAESGADTVVSTQLAVAGRYFRLAELCEEGTRTRVENYKKAEHIAEEVVEQVPDSADANFLLFAARGRRMLETDGRPSLTNVWKYTSVNKYLTRTLELNPNHADALAAKGGLLFDLPAVLGGDVDAARKHLELASRLNPTGAGTRLSLARVLKRQGERKAARDQALLAAHYACLKRTRPILVQAERLLAELASDTL